MAYFQSNKKVDAFLYLMKGENRLDDGAYTATTAKRITMIIPAGIRIFDTDLGKTFIGDGTVAGGTPERKVLNVRTVNVAAASGVTSIASGTSTINFAGAKYLRTGDTITLSGVGIPTPLTAATYYVVKLDDNRLTSQNTGLNIAFASGNRANALAYNYITLTSAGTAATCSGVIDGVFVWKSEDVLYVNPVSAAINVYLPFLTTHNGETLSIKRAVTSSNAVTIKGVDASGNILASGAMSVDATLGTGYITLKAATTDFVNIVADGVGGHWLNLGSQITP